MAHAAQPLMGPQQLYALWERQHWSALAIDLTQDRADWAALTSDERDDIVLALSWFLVGEERVTTQLSPLLMASETQAEQAFLATQQVDEARHAQMVNRCFRDVLGVDATFEEQLMRARGELAAELVQLFDVELVAAARALIDDPSDPGAKIDFITTYHLVIEGMLSLTGQHFLIRSLEARGILPGVAEAFRRIAADEHRHVAYGTWYLQQKAVDRRARRRIAARLAVLLPLTRRAFAERTLLGYPAEELDRFGTTALSRRVKVIGIVDVDRLPRQPAPS